MYRMGGDEFSIVFRRIDVDEADAIVRSLVDDPETPPFSYGVAAIPDDVTNLDALTQVADERMYEMKNSQDKERR